MNKKSTILDCHVVELNRIQSPTGKLTFLEACGNITFDIQRVYYLYDVPGGAQRGGHAHKQLYQLIVAASGAFDVVIDDGGHKSTIQLNRPYYGLIIVPGIWRELVNFSSGAICLVLASLKYDKRDYIRNYNNYLRFKDRKSL